MFPVDRGISRMFVESLGKFAQERGLRLETADFRGKKALVAAGRFNQLLAVAAKASADPDFGLHLGERFQASLAGGVLVGILANSPTLGRALENLCRYHNLMGDSFQLCLTQEGTRSCLAWHSQVKNLRFGRHFMEGVVLNVALRLRRLTDSQFQFMEVDFTHARPAATGEHRRLFGCPCKFGQPVDALLMKAADLDRPVFLADPSYLHHLERIARRALKELSVGEWTRQVGQAIHGRLPQGEPCTLQAIASSLAVSERLLQTKLKAEGTTFRRLLDQIRKTMALNYLRESGMNLFDIAYLLGFTDQSAFNHAFRRWTGAHPGKFRR